MSDSTNKLVAVCVHCGAVKERIQVERYRAEDVWTQSAGVVARARQMKLETDICCGCAGHSAKLGGFFEETHLGELLAV